MKAGDLVKIQEKHHGAYDPEDDRLGKLGLITEDLKPGHMAWVLWPPRPYQATMDYPDDLEVISESR
jgi:hypothetical protein|tara:strand:+ start:216 stop:416 length:201 start_codon:yes stop_codon:yes gene_type:complete